MASSDEDLLPPPLLPIKPPLQPGLVREGRGDKERERSAERVGDDLRRERANVVPAPSSTSEMICDGNRNVDLTPGYLQALLAKVRALGLMTSRGASAERKHAAGARRASAPHEQTARERRASTPR